VEAEAVGSGEQRCDRDNEHEDVRHGEEDVRNMSGDRFTLSILQGLK
jgi:hypothetical protein